MWRPQKEKLLEAKKKNYWRPNSSGSRRWPARAASSFARRRFLILQSGGQLCRGAHRTGSCKYRASVFGIAAFVHLPHQWPSTYTWKVGYRYFFQLYQDSQVVKCHDSWHAWSTNSMVWPNRNHLSSLSPKVTQGVNNSHRGHQPGVTWPPPAVITAQRKTHEKYIAPWFLMLFQPFARQVSLYDLNLMMYKRIKKYCLISCQKYLYLFACALTLIYRPASRLLPQLLTDQLTSHPGTLIAALLLIQRNHDPSLSLLLPSTDYCIACLSLRH